MRSAGKMAGAMTDSFLRRHQMLSLCFWITLLFSILYAMAAMDVMGQCYCESCSSSSPSITSGLGIITGIAAFVFVSQPCYGLYLLRIQCSELVAGMFIGSSAFATLWAFNEAILWRSEAWLALSIADQASLGENTTAVMNFKALSVLAWILFALLLFTTYSSCTSRDVLLEVSWGAPSHDYSQLPTQAGVSVVAGNKFSSYQTLDEEELEASTNGSEAPTSLAHYL